MPGPWKACSVGRDLCGPQRHSLAAKLFAKVVLVHVNQHTNVGSGAIAYDGLTGGEREITNKEEGKLRRSRR